MGQTPPQPVPEKRPDPKVVAAIDALSLKDVQLLANYAKWKMRGVTGRAGVRAFEWKDLMQEAFTKTLYGDRPWSPTYVNIPLTRHLIGCMRSIAHGWCKKESRYTPMSDEYDVSTGNLEEEKIAEIDAQAKAETNIQRLREELKNDGRALCILDAICRGTQGDLWHREDRNARRRILACAHRLFGSSEDTQR